MARRVVITGLGPMSALGIGIEPTWDAVVAGRCAIAPIQAFDPGGFDCRIAGEVKGFKVNKVVPKTYRKAVKVMARDIELAVGGADLAARDAGLKTKATADSGSRESDPAPQYPPDRMGAHIGAGLIGAELDELTSALVHARDEQGKFDIRKWGSVGLSHLTPLWLLKYLPNMLACHVTIIHGTQGPSNTITCGEASSGLSIGESLRVIQRGAADMCFCGGAESKINPMGFLRQLMTGRVNTTDNDNPSGAVRPFCKTAAGIVVGEGGAILAIESLETITERGAGDSVTLYAEIVGFGASQSLNPSRRNLVPEPSGRGIAVAIRAALSEAAIAPSEVDLIMPLGLGVAESDRAEAAALHRVFGDDLANVPIVSFKSLTGNCGAGAGGLDVCIAAKVLHEQTIPAVINCHEPLDGLQAGTSPARGAQLRYVLTFGGGMGGQNAALVLRKIEDRELRRAQAPRPTMSAANGRGSNSEERNAKRGPVPVTDKSSRSVHASASPSNRHLSPLEADTTAPRVVVSGMGWVTPLGDEIETVWSRLLAGKCAIHPTFHFDASTFPTSFSAQVRDYDHRALVRRPELHEGIGRNTGYALGAAAAAWRAARLDELEGLDHERLGIYLGSGEGVLDFDNYVAVNLEAWDDQKNHVDTVRWAHAARRHMDAVREIEQEPNMPLAHLAMEFDVLGPSYNCLTACAASTQAIGEATEIIRRGDADVMMAGGSHTMIQPLGLTGFNRLTALSTRNDEYQSSARPFDRTRDGFVLGEGAGMLILETLEHAQKRGAPIFGEIIGYGSSADAFRITDIQPQGQGGIASMQQALDQARLVAGVSAADIDFISSHGTGTKENDSIETKAVKAVFGAHAAGIPMNSIKSMIGHLIAAAGAVELIVCLLAIRDHKLPPTINLHQPDPECDLDYVPNVSRDVRVDVALSNSFGFGGQNDTLIVRRVR